MNRWGIVVFCWLMLGVSALSAETAELAAIIRVIGQDITFQRVNTQTELPLRAGSVSLFGIGDQIRTGENGRVLITLQEGYEILLLPNSEYAILDFALDEAGVVRFNARLSGIAIHNFMESADLLHYYLLGETFEITAATGDFAVWSVPNLGLQAVTNASGVVDINLEGGIQAAVTGGMGYAVSYSTEPILLAMPLHASQLVAQSVNCEGIVNTNSTEGLRLRIGAALDFLVVDSLEDNQVVSIAGTTENGLWYRIPFQTGFGWIYSSLIKADCEGLRRFPNLYGEAPEHIRGATPNELAMLSPFYGNPVTNRVFYR